MKRTLLVCLALEILALSVPSTHAHQPQPARSLYDWLGGVYPISVVVDDFIERLLVNETLNANPAIDRARTAVPEQGLKFHVTTLVCEATGGPCKYVGRTMKASHAHLDISDEDWAAMVADFKATLDAFSVPDQEQRELMAIVESTKADIVKSGEPSSR